MKILYELSWLWGTLGIALVAAAVCMACGALIGRAAKHWCDYLWAYISQNQVRGEVRKKLRLS